MEYYKSVSFTKESSYQGPTMQRPSSPWSGGPTTGGRTTPSNCCSGSCRVLRLTADQEAVLQEQFHRFPGAPHSADIILLAAETGLSESEVQDWYNIKLAEWRKGQGLGGNIDFSQ